MARRSSIDRLPETLRVAIADAIKSGLTIDEIFVLMQEEGADVSRSAVGRYAKSYREIASRQRELSAVATSFAGEFGDTDNKHGKLLIQMFTSIMTQQSMTMASGDVEDFDPKDLHFFARAIKDVVSAAKIDTDRDAKVREEAIAKTRTEAVKAAEKGMRGSGASEETIRTVKEHLLGIGKH